MTLLIVTLSSSSSFNRFFGGGIGIIRGVSNVGSGQIISVSGSRTCSPTLPASNRGHFNRSGRDSRVFRTRRSDEFCILFWIRHYVFFVTVVNNVTFIFTRNGCCGGWIFTRNGCIFQSNVFVKVMEVRCGFSQILADIVFIFRSIEESMKAKIQLYENYEGRRQIWQICE